MTAGGWIVDSEVVRERSLWVGDTLLFRPEDFLALLLGDFCPGDEDDRLFEVVSVSHSLLDVRDLDVNRWVESVQFGDSYFTQPGGSPESGGESCVYRRVLGIVGIEVRADFGEVIHCPGFFLLLSRFFRCHLFASCE